MIESQRQAYLEAMDITVWVPRAVEKRESIRLAMTPGSGSTLLLCRDAGEKSSALSADIARYLGGDPVWAWPDPQKNPANPLLEEAIDRQLFTHIVIFGSALAERVFHGETPPVVRSAQTTVSADLDELAVSGNARKSLWQKLSATHPAAVA